MDLAAFKGHVECVDVLINQGASILVKDYILKRTPIHAAGMSKTLNDFIYYFPSNTLFFFTFLYIILLVIVLNILIVKIIMILLSGKR